MYRSGLEGKVADLLSSLKVSYEYESRKLAYVLECNYNPDLDIRFVFQAPFNKIYKGSKTTYAKWAEKSGFPWCSYQSIPIEWLT
jgi:hypothetical protein